MAKVHDTLGAADGAIEIHLKVKSKPPKQPPSVRNCGAWKDDPERMEMNRVAEATGEDRDYVDLEPPYNTGI